MARSRLSVGLVYLAMTSSASLATEPPHVQRTPDPKVPVVQSMERSGQSASVAWWAQPGLGLHEAGGYVGGGSLKGNRVFSKSSGGTGPIHEGTFGWDFVGFGGRLGRVFLGSSPTKPKEKDVNAGYRIDGHPVSDVFSHRPIRKAVIQAKEDSQNRTTAEKE